MKKLLILLILLFGSTAYGFNPFVVFSGVPAVSGVTCSGDMTDGDNESFEKGTDQFCTTDWTLSETDAGVINTFDSTKSHCGSTSFSIISDSDNANSNRIYIDLGSADDDFYIRGYIILPSMTSNDALKTMYIGSTNDSVGSGILYTQWWNNGGTYKFIIRSVATNPAEYYNLTPDVWYRFEIHAVKSNTSSLKIFTSAGAAVETSTGGGDVTLDITGAGISSQYIVFKDISPSATAYTTYYDDIKLDLSGASYIGEEICP